MANEIESVLASLEQTAKGQETVKIGDILAGLGERGFGPILLILSMFLILPVGMIPGMPGVVGAALIIVGWQLFRGKKGIWLPYYVTKRHLPVSTIGKIIAKIRPLAERTDRLFGHRLQRLTQNRIVLITGGAGILLSGSIMVTIGFIPGLPATLALPILLFGLGLTTGNGVVVLAGYALVIPAVILIFWLLG
ncbi:exopolysaccharide biosynthesis protein [Aestuariibius sp. 2305UL40-4]|uniref:exopolysaccharide biosynthesis protein n=1 Tax=Aestuariibius violaceus TaxID=3234132 RepID=UPI00345F053C